MATATYVKPAIYRASQIPQSADALPQWLSRFVTDLRPVLEPLYKAPGHDVILLEGVSLTAGYENLVEHGLGRKYRGWRLAGINAFAMVCDDASATDSPELFLPLLCTADCTVNLEVF